MLSSCSDDSSSPSDDAGTTNNVNFNLKWSQAIGSERFTLSSASLCTSKGTDSAESILVGYETINWIQRTAQSCQDVINCGYIRATQLDASEPIVVSSASTSIAIPLSTISDSVTSVKFKFELIHGIDGSVATGVDCGSLGCELEFKFDCTDPSDAGAK